MAENFRSDPNYPILREFKAGLDVPELLRRHGAHAMGIAPKVSEGAGPDQPERWATATSGTYATP